MTGNLLLLPQMLFDLVFQGLSVLECTIFCALSEYNYWNVFRKVGYLNLSKMEKEAQS
jgi:hypothetical protein